MSTTDKVTEAASLADAVLTAEAERQAAHEDEEILFADDLLPGVGAEELTLKQGLAVGGTFTFAMLLLLNGVENLEGASLGVLAPDIRDSFGVSDGVIVFVSAASSAFIVLGALPMGWLADRYRRPPIIAAAAVVFSVFVFLSGLAVNAFTLFLARLGRRGRQVLEHHRPPVTGRRRLPDRRPRPTQRHQPGQRPADRCDQPGPGRRHRQLGGWPRWLALVVLHPRTAGPGPRVLRVCASPRRPGASSR